MVTAAIPLESLKLPSVLDELSGKIDELAPTAFNEVEKFSAQIEK